jgi:FAD/FMN-containing dehydrogenase
MMIPREDASGYIGEAERLFTPANESELTAILRDKQPITIAGAGTGVTGGSVPQGGSVISMDRFSNIEISPGRARAGAGCSIPWSARFIIQSR